MGEGHKGGKNFSWRLGGRLRCPPRAKLLRAREPLRSGPRPLPGSACPAPAALHPEDPPPRHRTAGAEGERPREARMRTPSEVGSSELSWCTSCAGPLGGARALCWLLAAGCSGRGGWRGPRSLWRGADLTLCWPSRGWGGGEQRRPRAPTDTSGARASRLPGPPLDVARPDPHPQQFTCWSLASG